MVGNQGRLSIQGATDEILRRQRAAPPQPQARAPDVRYGQPPTPRPSDVEEFRRQQAAFASTTRELDGRNAWMAIPALAPAVAVLGLEGAAALAARLAGPVVSRGPHVLTEPMPYIRVGDNWATRAGRRADQAVKALARSKADKGWTAEPHVKFEGKLLKPDVGAPARGSDPTVRRYIELKPNTPTGRAAAARQVKKYKEATGQNVRAMFYDPKKFL